MPGDGPPSPRHAPSCSDVQESVDKLVRSLKRGRGRRDLLDLAVRLGNCTPEKQCGSGACPRCVQAALADATEAIARIPRRPVPPAVVPIMLTVTIQSMCVPVGALHKFDLPNALRRLKRAFTSAGLSWCVGALDLSLNEHQGGAYPPYWAVHVHAFGMEQDPAQTGTALRRVIRPSAIVMRPVMVKRWDGAERAVSYSFKTHFGRRIACDDMLRFKRGGHGVRLCRTTKTARLRAAELHELLLFLDRIGPKGRLFQYNAFVRDKKLHAASN